MRQFTTAGVLQLETAVLSTITHEETRDLANAEEKAEEDRGNSLTRQIGDSFSDIVVSSHLNLIYLKHTTTLRTGRFLNQPISMKGYNSKLTDTLTYFIQENLGGSGAISTEEAEEYLREHMKIEGDLERQRQEKKEMQIAAVKERLEQRKKERMRKLKEKQDLERAQVRFLSAKTPKKI